MGKPNARPILRFKEFENTWTQVRLGDIASNIMYGLNRAGINYDGQNKYIRITDIEEETRRYQPNPLSSPEGDLDRAYRVNENDLLFARTGASTGKCYLYDVRDGNLFFAGFLIRFNIVAGDPYFVYSYTFRSAYKKWVQIMSMRSGQPGINAEEYKSLRFFAPGLPEQQKIASFLTSVDTKIQQLTQKKALLEQYKKGVMQKIFKQEIRFKDERGRDYPEWEKMSLGDLLSFKSTKSYSRSQLNYESGAYRYIHYGDIHTKYRSMFDVTKEDVPFINTDVQSGMIADENICKPGYLVIVDTLEDHKDLGKTIEIIETGNQSIIAGLHTFLARDENGLTVVGFKGYLMQVHKVRNQIMTKGTGISVLGISKSNLAKVRISLPSKAEQRKIVDFLTAIDKNIYAIGQQVELTKQFKKGLLQQMFV